MIHLGLEGEAYKQNQKDSLLQRAEKIVGGREG